MALSSRPRRDEVGTDETVVPVQFRLEARDERVTSEDGRDVRGRGYVLCDAKTGEPLGEDDFFFRMGGGIVCDLAGPEWHSDELQSSVFSPGQTLALVRVGSPGDYDPPVIEVRDATGRITVGQLPPDVADAVIFYGTETYGAALCLWEWRMDSGRRFALRLLLAPGWTVEPIAEEPLADV